MRTQPRRPVRKIQKQIPLPRGDVTSPAGQTQWRMLADDSRRLPPSRPDAGRSDQVGRRLQAAFARIIATFPAGVGRVADIVRWLDLDRSVCQRVMMGVRDAVDGLGVLERFPGVRGLEQFIDAAEARQCPKPALEEARAALEAYAQLVSDAGGSQARLVEHIETLRTREGVREGSPSPADMEKWRRRSYEAAVGMTGLASAARVDVVMVAPDGQEPGRMTTVSATGMIGVEAAPYAMPLTRRSRLAGLTPVPQDSGPESQRPASDLTPDLLLRPFTSEPPPRVTTRTEGEYLLQVFNAENDGGTPFDVVAGMAFSWPWNDPKAPEENFYSVGRVIGPPTRRLVLDLYLHRSLPPATAVTTHMLRPGVQGSLGDARPGSRWFDRLPIEHDLILLGGSPGDRPSEAYPRLGELTRFLVDSMEWGREQFTGYRLEVPYPVFDHEYVIAAEF